MRAVLVVGVSISANVDTDNRCLLSPLKSFIACRAEEAVGDVLGRGPRVVKCEDVLLMIDSRNMAKAPSKPATSEGGVRNGRQRNVARKQHSHTLTCTGPAHDQRYRVIAVGHCGDYTDGAGNEEGEGPVQSADCKGD